MKDLVFHIVSTNTIWRLTLYEAEAALWGCKSALELPFVDTTQQEGLGASSQPCEAENMSYSLGICC